MDLWFIEREDDTVHMRFRVRQVLHQERSAYQEIVVAELDAMGRALILDDAIQVTERDAFIYHEMLVHVPLCAHPAPRRVLIIGGGDLGAAFEVARHAEVTEIDLVELDQRVVEVSAEHFSWARQVLRDPRLRIRFQDGARFVGQPGPPYDVILADAPDPVGPAEVLFGEPFYEAVRRRLRPGGVFVTQSGSMWFQPHLWGRVGRTLARVFGHVHLYLASVPTYSIGPWTFTGASLGPDLRIPQAARAARLKTRHYSPELHRAAFSLPPFIRERLEREARPEAAPEASAAH
ncbi:MAG: polyamine aminopropyltransferase [Bacillota bacterium]